MRSSHPGAPPAPPLPSLGDADCCLSLRLLWEEQCLPLPPFWQSDELPARPGNGKCLWRCVGKQEVTFGNGGPFVCSASLCEQPVPDTSGNRNPAAARGTDLTLAATRGTERNRQRALSSCLQVTHRNEGEMFLPERKLCDGEAGSGGHTCALPLTNLLRVDASISMPPSPQEEGGS